MPIIQDRQLYKDFEAVRTDMAYDDLALALFFAGLIRKMRVVIVEKLPGGSRAAAMFKGTKPHLILSMDYFKAPFKTQKSVYTHEMIHFIYKHPIIYAKFFGQLKLKMMSPGGHIQAFDVMNLGVDCFANDKIPKARQLPEWFYPATFRLPSGHDSMFYANKIADLFDPPPPEDNEENYDPYTGALRAPEPPSEEELERLRQQLAKAYGEDPDTGLIFEPHMVWVEGVPELGEPDFDPDLQEEVVHQMIREAAESVPDHLRGTLPGVVKDVIERAYAPAPAVPWYRVLHSIVARWGKSVLRSTVIRKNQHTRMRPGKKLKTKWKLLLALDSSASMTDEWWMRIVNEIHWAHMAGAEIHVVYHDTTIYETYRYRGSHVHLRFDRQSGGTDHTEVVEYFNKHQFDAGIFCTDGYTAVREGLRPRGQVVWAVTADGQNPNGADYTDIDFGTCVRMRATEVYKAS